MLRLPDTGQTTSYTSTFGEDNDYTIYSPYFTLNGNGTVTDTITGLMWQFCKHKYQGKIIFHLQLDC